MTSSTYILLLPFVLLMTLDGKALSAEQKAAIDTPKLQTASNLAIEDSSLDRVAEIISGHDVIRSTLIQEKHLQILKRPLVSKGRMIYQKERGLYWEIYHPYSMSLVLTDKGMTVTVGGKRRHETVQGNPLLAGISQVLLSVFEGDTSSLSEIFDIEAQSSAESWSLNLTPQKGQLGEIIKSISLTGNESVEEIVVEEVSGDRTFLSFHNISYEPDTLSKEEISLFVE